MKEMRFKGALIFAVFLFSFFPFSDLVFSAPPEDMVLIPRGKFMMGNNASDGKMGFEIGAEFRTTEYDDLVPIRDEDLTKLSLGISRSMVSDWQLLAQYTYANNDSSDPTFSYTRNQFTVGVLKIF